MEHKNYLFFFILIAAFSLLYPDLLLAQNLNDSVGQRLCNIVSVLVGPAGQAIATAAVCFLGIGAFFGKVNWGLALTVATGIIAIFAAVRIVDGIRGAGTDCNAWM